MDEMPAKRRRRAHDQRSSGGSTLGRGGGLGTGPQIVARPPNFSRTLDTLWSTDSQKKMSKFDAARCQTLRRKCTEFDFRWGSVPDPTGGAYSIPPDLLAVFKWVYF